MDEVRNNVKLEYMEANCYRYTFDEKKVLDWVIKRLEGKVLNLFLGKNKLKEMGVDEVSVDMDSSWCPDYVMDAGEFVKDEKWLNYFDVIIYDPPWNRRKSKEKYKGFDINRKMIGVYTKMKDDIVKCLKPGGIIVSLGYHITEFGLLRKMMLDEVLVVNPKGEIRPYFVSVERLKNGFKKLKNGM